MPEILSAHEGPVARLTIANPEARNGITPEMADQLAAAVDTAAADPAIRVVVVSGQGDHFCAGADLRSAAALVTQSDEAIEAYIHDHMHAVVNALHRCPKPTVAVVRGAAVGIRAVVRDGRRSAHRGRRRQLGVVFAKIGLHPDGGSSYLLPRLVGTSRAVEMMMFGETMSGERAEAIGLVQRAVPPGRPRRGLRGR